LERTSSIADRIKESFNKTVTTESEIMELYSNVDMLIIDDFGSETISKWALEKLYRIINNRYENELPIVITTRYTREELMEEIAIENRKLAEEVIQILYKMCYGISLIKNDRNAKEKASKSDKTKC
jgi:DNA replication protein DnaC